MTDNAKITVTKLDAARRQLRTAIRLWFEEGDPVSIHTLAAPGRIDCARPPLARRTSCRRDRKCGKHCQARAVQRSEGQHDDLACLPGARSRESGHRGTAASWHGSGPPRRHARHVVSAAPHARTSFGVTGIRTESLPLAVSVSGKRDFGAREKCAENGLC